MAKVEYLDVDDDVRVFAVGDIHGEYSKLINRLKEIGFDFEHDLLIAVGDLVDRGKEDIECVQLLDKKWFKTVMGNHEDFCIQGKDDSSIAFYHKMTNNGGEWFYKLSEVEQECVVDKFKQLPILLELRYKGKKYGFVHADLPYQDWEHVKACVESDDLLDGRSIVDHCIWSRGIVNSPVPVYIAQVDEVFFGHTPLIDIGRIGNCTFIDTGAVFGGKLSIVELGV